MNKSRSLALVAAGSLSRSLLNRLPVLARDLGPVLTPCHRLASRVVNVLRAGYPVENYEALQQAHTLLIAVPDELLGEVVSALERSAPEWAGKVVLLCDSLLESLELEPLARRGAATGSVNPIAGLSKRYVVEGDRPAVRAARHLIHDEHARAFEIPRGRKAVFLAALIFAGPLLLAPLDASAQCLRAAGLPAPVCHGVTEQLIQRALRSYLHGGRRAWGGLPPPHDALRQLAALEAADPALARCYRQLAELALWWFANERTSPRGAW